MGQTPWVRHFFSVITIEIHLRLRNFHANYTYLLWKPHHTGNTCLNMYSTACHKLFFRGWEKAATYGRIGNLWQAAATYDLPTMISENWIHFGWFSRLFGAKNRFHAFFVTQNGEKSKQEIETLRKAIDLYDKERPSRVLSLKLRKKLHERSKSRRKWWVFFAKNLIIL